MSYPLEEQFEIYAYGVTRRAPAEIELAFPLASNGRPLVPLLLDQLQKAESEVFQERLLRVLGVMSCFYADLSTDEQVIAVAARVVVGMQDEYWRKFGEEHLAKIRRQGCPTWSPGGQ